MYASFWKRVAAFLIDYILVGILSYVIAFILGLVMALLLHLQTEEPPQWGALLAVLVMVGVLAVYYVYAESSPWQATVGKRIMGIKVTDMNGNRISFWRSFGRRAAMAISSVTFFIGYMMCGWTQRKQCLHDKIASCLVVDKNYVPGQPPAPAAHKMPWWAIALCCIPVGLVLLGFLSALFAPSVTKAVEQAHATAVAKQLRETAGRQLLTYMETGKVASTWENLLIRPVNGVSDAYCMEGPQIFNPQNYYASCGGKKTWVLVLGPKEVTAWRTNAWKYRLVVPYETRIPQCVAEETGGTQTFCDKLNATWKINNMNARNPAR